MAVDTTLLVLRWMHIFASITLIGGLVYQRFVVLPAVGSLDEGARQSLASALRGPWSKLVMISTLLLLVSGIVNIIVIVKTFKPPDAPLPRYYHPIFGVKFLIALAIFFLASMLAGRSEAAERFRRRARMWLNVTILLAVVLVALSNVLRGAHSGPNLPPVPPPETADE